MLDDPPLGLSDGRFLRWFRVSTDLVDQHVELPLMGGDDLLPLDECLKEGPVLERAVGKLGDLRPQVSAVLFEHVLSHDEFGQLAVHILENAMLNGETIRLDGAIRMAPR